MADQIDSTTTYFVKWITPFGSYCREFLTSTVIPSTLNQIQIGSAFTNWSNTLSMAIEFQYFDSDIDNRDAFFRDIIRFFNDVYFIAPLEAQMRLVDRSGGESYFYVNSYKSK